jgi:threonine synthase
VALTDQEILEAQGVIARLAGVFAEPAAATSVAAAKKLRDRGVVGRDDLVVCNLTGHGLKQPEAIKISEKQLTPIAPTLTALSERVRESKT